jgi:O-antigen ligase
MINNRTNNILSISIILIIPLLITGPFIPDLILTVCSIYFFFLLIIKNNFEFIKKPFFLFFLLFIIFIIISSILSNNFKSIISSVGYIRFLLFIFFTIFIIQNSKKDLLLLIFYSLFFTNIYLIFEFLWQFFFQTTILGDKVFNPQRFIISSFYHEEIYSSYIVRIFPFFLGLFFLNKNKLNSLIKITSYIILTLLMFTVFFNGERTAIGLLAISILFLLTFLDFDKKIKFIALITVFIGFFIILNHLPTNNLDRKINGAINFKTSITKFLNKNEDYVIFSKKYDSMYKTGLNIYKYNLITGIGIKNFRIECSKSIYASNEKSCSTHPHNLAIQLLAETGSIGLIFYLSIIFLLTRLLFKNLKNKSTSKNHKNYITCLLCCFLVSLWPFFPSGNFFNNWMSIITFYPAGFLLHETSLLKKN